MIKQTEFLYPYQYDAVDRMQNGCILNGGVGSGKSRTALYYYFKENGGSIIGKNYKPMTRQQDLYIITTAMKRDKLEWDQELIPYLLSTDPKHNRYKNKVVIDSWNCIEKYKDVSGAFFIFDEDRVTGYGKWAKTFIKLAKKNDWVILSATAGDKWEDYISVFIANGFYRNKTEFSQEHILYDPRCKNFPKVMGYRNTGRLIRLRNKILIPMDFERTTIPHHEDVYASYDIQLYRDVMKRRWDPFKNEPIQNAASFCTILRRVVNCSEDRQMKLLELLEDHPKAIIFYNYNFERDILLNLGYSEGTKIAEWSGFAHQEIPEGDKFVYLVQYTAGAEGWNTLRTDTVIFYSQSYSYRATIQAAGRIDRLNTPYRDLYYYHIKSRSGIDLVISRTLAEKKNFNEGKFIKW